MLKTVSYFMEDKIHAFIFLLSIFNIFLNNFFFKQSIRFHKKQFQYLFDQEKTSFRCLENGWPERGSREFWPYYFYPNFPSLHDIFEDNGYLKAVLSTHLIETHSNFKPRMKLLHTSTWALYFHENNETKNRNFTVNKHGILTKPTFDPEIQVIKLIFKIPPEYQNKYNFATIQRVLDDNDIDNISYRPIDENEPLYNPKYYEGGQEMQGGIQRTKIFMKMPENQDNINDLSYRNVPFCQIKDKYSIYVNPIPENRTDNFLISENGQPKDYLRICTQNRIFDSKEKNEIIFRWVLYNLEQGFSKPIIYINKIDENESLAMPHFANLIKKDMVEMIYFVFPYAFFFHEQFSQEISCLERNKGRAVWLGHDDVDERFFNTGTNETILEYLKRFSVRNDITGIGGIKTPNEWMERMDDDTTFTDTGNREYFAKAKNIIVADNVEVYYVHLIKNGKRTIRQDDIVNAHFKDIKTGVVKFKNKILSPRMTEINQRLTKKIHELIA